ncbi:MAG: hypothetical protein PHP62_03595, partial [Candidatus Moranbacteria bacterium]|nr:hypothetical protein [Candidatus Moranbacteria bacterium]
MKKRQIDALGKGSADYIVAHAARQHKRGKRPSVTFRKERNPEKALALAKCLKDAKLAVCQADEKQWSVLSKGTVVAQVHMGYQLQADKVVLMDDSKFLQRCVKELALSHAIQFVMHRPPMSAAIFNLIPELDLEEYTCENLMSFEKIPASIIALSNEKLDAYLSEFVTVVEGKFSSPEQMLTRLLMDIFEKKGVLVGVRDAKWAQWQDDMIIAMFEIKSDHIFKVWTSSDSDRSSKDWRFHFTPPYHPVMDKKKKSICMINGDTDAYIRGSELGITYVYSPEEARAKKEGFGTSWSYMKHPFYAEGKTLGVGFSSTLCMSKMGYDALYQLLIAALNMNDLYIEVNGGFNSPYDFAQNILNRKGIKSPAGKHGSHEVRGSEEDCVWEHQVLNAEG